jgi:hypothetical protein
MGYLGRSVRTVRVVALAACIVAISATTALAGDRDKPTPPGQEKKVAPPAPSAPAAPAPPVSAAPPAPDKTPPGQAKTPPARPVPPAPGAGKAAPPSRPAPPAAGKTPPGQTKTPRGQAKTPPGQAKTPPGQAKKAPARVPAGTPGAVAPPTPVPAATAPVLGESMGVKAVDGAVQVRLPQSSGYAPLGAVGSIPSGAIVDARAGSIELRTAVGRSGRTQAATIGGAVFEVRQSATRNGMTDLILRQGRPSDCPRAGRGLARAAAAHPVSAKSARGRSTGLWARDRHGRFRSRGRNSVATVRGTRWVTRETCAGTLTRVLDGAVDVRDLRKHRTVRVGAGHSYLARDAG